MQINLNKYNIALIIKKWIMEIWQIIILKYKEKMHTNHRKRSKKQAILLNISHNHIDFVYFLMELLIKWSSAKHCVDNQKRDYQTVKIVCV